jgi:hypothetical protein
MAMARARTIEIELLPGARRLLAAHAAALPQRDDLCGAFCGALALRAALIEDADDGLLDQDAVALAAGSVISAVPEPHHLPRGERSRRDYRLTLPLIEDAAVSGTTPGGLAHALEQLSRGAVEGLPLAGPWTTLTLARLFDRLSAIERPVSVLANLATRHLWGAGATVEQLLAYLLDGSGDGPPPDWDVGHFVCLVGRVVGPGGTLYGVADTYPSLGSRGVHAQPAERLARALQRPDMPPGGLIVAASNKDAPAVRAVAVDLGLHEGAWDNGTVRPEMLA